MPAISKEIRQANKLWTWVDHVTYAVHDASDFFRAGLVPLDRLSTGILLGKERKVVLNFAQLSRSKAYAFEMKERGELRFTRRSGSRSLGL